MSLWLTLLPPFAGGYFLSYLFRTANAVIGPGLAGELHLSAGDLGLLTSAYFLAFGLAQIPLGILLDRYGPRRVEAGLLVIAALGSLVFALGENLTQLTLGRALIGLGVCACLMAAFKAFSQWFPPLQLASLTGWIMSSGGLGALVAASPLEAALGLLGWRRIFLFLAVATLMVAAWIFFAVPDKPSSSSRASALSEQWLGVRQVFRSFQFWRYAPLGVMVIGGFMAVQGLWSGVWLMGVNGYSRATAAEHLSGMSLALVLSYIGIGLSATRLAHRGIRPVVLMVTGLWLSTLALGLILIQATTHTLWLWMAFGACSSFGTLSYTQMALGFPNEVSGRASTAFNLMVFAGAFGLQWGLGLLVDLGQGWGIERALSLRLVFSGYWALQVLALLWFWLAPKWILRQAP